MQVSNEIQISQSVPYRIFPGQVQKEDPGDRAVEDGAEQADRAVEENPSDKEDTAENEKGERGWLDGSVGWAGWIGGELAGWIGRGLGCACWGDRSWE